jgi:uncharacterized Fe-S cluster-containing MiaB family protein
MQSINKKDSLQIQALHTILENERGEYNDLVVELNARIAKTIKEFASEQDAKIKVTQGVLESTSNKLSTLVEAQVKQMTDYEQGRSMNWQIGDSGSKYGE